MQRAPADGVLDSEKVSGVFFGGPGLELIAREVIQPTLLARPSQ